MINNDMSSVIEEVDRIKAKIVCHKGLPIDQMFVGPFLFHSDGRVWAGGETLLVGEEREAAWAYLARRMRITQ